jgi:hypothetical protein
MFDDLEAQPPPAESAGESSKPWYRRWWAVTLGALLTLFVITGIFGDNTDSTTTNDATAAATSEPPSPSRSPRPRRQRQPRLLHPRRQHLHHRPSRRPHHRPSRRPHHRPSRSLHHRPSRSRRMNATRRTTHAFPLPVTSTAKAGAETARSTPEEFGSSGRMNTTWIATATASAATSEAAAEEISAALHRAVPSLARPERPGQQRRNPLRHVGASSRARRAGNRQAPLGRTLDRVASGVLRTRSRS